MFVFDVSDTEALDGAPPLPASVTHPFSVRKGVVGHELERTIENAKRDGVGVYTRSAGSQSAGAIQHAMLGGRLSFQVRQRPRPESVDIQEAYELFLNERHSREAQYATLTHELAHLYCGHLGTPSAEWWPDRRGLDLPRREFEAESVSYIVCRRLGIDPASEEYLSGYLSPASETPDISLDAVMKAAGLIDQMGRQRLKVRPPVKRKP